MSKIKFINSEKDYEEALKLAEELIMLDPETNSDEGEQLAILTALIKDYELKSFPVSLPSPVEAIKFRMEQSGLTKNDLIPFIGSKSRVSEIFNGKRQLTMEMVRRLESGLGIPAKVLIQKTTINDDSNFELWNNKLFNEMTLRGYFGSNKVNKNEKSFLLENFFSSIGLKTPVVGLMRKSSFRSSPGTDKQALSV
jgi:HTH-type transcriptional regulator/antitoxin HigA